MPTREIRLELKIRKDLWLAWKIQAAKEERTMSEIAEQLISDYVKKKGGRSQ